jgi:hypothetical protein
MYIEDIFGTEDRVAVRLSFRGMHHGAFKASRRPADRCCSPASRFARVSGDLLAEKWVSPDMSTLMHRITAPVADPMRQHRKLGPGDNVHTACLRLIYKLLVPMQTAGSKPEEVQ